MSGLSVGSTFAGCRLDAVAGRGGMGVVYRAHQIALDRPVALKAIAPALVENTAYRERFQREAHLAASIDHPNVIPVYEAGELDGSLYLIMRWVDGTDLRALLAASGRLPPPRAVRLLRPIASALAAAHRRGLVHRDIKPANVLIASGEEDGDEHPYLTDFGIARRAEEGGTMTRTGVLVGTLDYTAPERIEGAKATPASDIYSFGCMLFEALTGSIPFEREREVQKLYAHVHEQPPSARAAAPEVPVGLDAAIMKAMAKEPGERFESAAQLASVMGQALEEVEPGEAATVLEPGEPATVLQPGEPPPVLEPDEPGTVLVTGATEPAETEIVLDDRPPPAPTAPQEPAQKRRRRRMLAAAVGIAVVIGAVVALVASGGSGSGRTSALTSSAPSTGSASAIAAPQVQSGSVIVDPPVELGAGSTPTSVALTGSDLWVADRAQGRLVLISGGRIQRTVPVSGQPDKVAVDPQLRLWVTQPALSQVTVDAIGPHPRSVKVGSFPGPIAMTTDAAWIANTGENTVTRIDLATLSSTLPSPPVAIGQEYARVWVASSSGAITVLDDDGSLDRVEPPVGVPSPVVAISSSNGVWFLSAGNSSQGGVLTRVDPRQEGVAERVGGRLRYVVHPRQAIVGSDPRDVEAFTGSQIDNTIWVTSGSDKMLRRIRTTDPGNNTTVAEVGFGAPPEALAVAPGVAWVAVPTAGLIYRLTY
jgi:tRNA A-37 threonylcarbamoyl transferase component Bud32